MENVVETKVQLSEGSIQKILTAEVAKIVMNNPDIINNIIENVLFTRPEKRNSYDKEPPTFFEIAVKKTFEPMMQEIIAEELQTKRNTIKKIVSKALKTHVLDHGEFASRLIESMSKFTSNISFYVRGD